MGNPIQYRNTDNPSQIQGWVSHNKGGFHKMAFIIMVCPPGCTQGGNEKRFTGISDECRNLVAVAEEAV